MNEILKRSLASILTTLDLGLKKKRQPKLRYPIELNEEERGWVDHVLENKLTMVSPERLFATALACKHALDQNIAGDFVECGVWRGGNAMVAAAIFNFHKADKKVYLYDTFEGMTMPTDADRKNSDGTEAVAEFVKHQKADHNDWCYASLEDVRDSFQTAGLLSDSVVFVKGDVLKTLELKSVPSKISVLRLDTDWYESTKRELEILYPKLSFGGTLIIDDYGHWAGSKKAVDEYFQRIGKRPFLQYTDPTGRAAVKYQ
jgi:O-methyltransferase